MYFSGFSFVPLGSFGGGLIKQTLKTSKQEYIQEGLFLEICESNIQMCGDFNYLSHKYENNVSPYNHVLRYYEVLKVELWYKI